MQSSEKRKKMNIYDIAKEAGVSISTVSRVMNNKGNVNAATRKKVEAILDKHDYTPSAIARGMVSKTMKTVAVLTVDIRVPHYARTVYTIEREFSHRGYEVAICNTGGELEETAKYLKTMLEKKVDGIVLVGSIFNTLCKNLYLDDEDHNNKNWAQVWLGPQNQYEPHGTYYGVQLDRNTRYHVCLNTDKTNFTKLVRSAI